MLESSFFAEIRLSFARFKVLTEGAATHKCLEFVVRRAAVDRAVELRFGVTGSGLTVKLIV